MMTPIEMVKTAIKALDDKKAHDIQIVRVDTVTSIADYFVICTGTSNTHIKTLKEAVEHDVELAGERPHHVEGHGSGTWVLMDYLSVVVHIFTDEARRFYQLDRVWADAEILDAQEFLNK